MFGVVLLARIVYRVLSVFSKTFTEVRVMVLTGTETGSVSPFKYPVTECDLRVGGRV